MVYTLRTDLEAIGRILLGPLYMAGRSDMGVYFVNSENPWRVQSNLYKRYYVAEAKTTVGE